MKLPSLTSIVIFLVIVGLIFLSLNIYKRVAIEGNKALKEATAEIDAYDAERERKKQYITPQNFGGGTTTKKDEKEASKKAEEARQLLLKKSSESRARKQEKK